MDKDEPFEWLFLQPHIAAGEGRQRGDQWWIGTVNWEGEMLALGAGNDNGGQSTLLWVSVIPCRVACS